MKVRTTRLAGTAIVLMAVAAHACSPSEPPPRPGATRIPGINLHLDDSIDAFDFAVEGDSVLHLVWITTEAKRKVSHLWYRREYLATSRWTDPIRLPSGSLGKVRIFAGSDTLHILVGPSLRHLQSVSNGQTWTEVGRVLSSDQMATEFDAAKDRDGIWIVYATKEKRDERYHPEGPFSLWATRLANPPWSGRELISRIDKTVSTNLNLRLLAQADSLLLFYTTTETMQGQTPNSFRMRGRIFLSRGSGRGGTWSTPVEVTPSDVGTVAHLDALPVRGRVILLYQDHLLYVAQSEAGGHWSRGTLVSRVPESWVSKAQRTLSVSAAALDTVGQVVWVDTRYSRTDRTALNPLGGVPWSDQPEWANNDVLAVPLSALVALTPSAPALKPTRLTRDLSYAEQVRARSGSHRVYIVWSGRVKVGRDVNSYGEPWTLFFMSLPAE